MGVHDLGGDRFELPAKYILMKTIKEWLETLPEPYRTQALENAKNCLVGCGRTLDVNQGTLSDAVAGAFIWLLSPQGEQYWEDFEKATP